MFWCQIPQDTFRGLVQSMPRRVGAVLAAHRGPTAYQTGGHNVLAHQYIYKIKTHSHLSPVNGRNNQLALIESIKPRWLGLHIYKSTPPMFFQPKKLHKATKKGYQGKLFAVSNPSQSSSTAVKTFTHSTHMRIAMLHTPSTAGLVSSLIGESSATAQT